MEKILASWELMSQSFRVLKADKELMWLPVLSGISCLLVTAAAVAIYYPGIAAAVKSSEKWQPEAQFVIGATFVFYFVNYFTMVFFNTALVGAANIRLQGGDPTVRDGLHLAWERKWLILEWAAVAATVGMILNMIERRASLIGRLVAGIIGLAWALASFLVVPVLAFEDVGPFDALKRSAELFRKTWGEQVTGVFSFGLVSFFLMVPGIMLPILGHLLMGEFGLIIGSTLLGLYIIIIMVVTTATRGIFVTALYRYATTGEAAPGFYRQNFAGAFKSKW